MADDDGAQADEGQGAHGPAAAGHGKKRGSGLLNGPHREMIIMVASVVGVGLAYATLHRSSATGSSSAQTAAMSYPGSSAVLSSGQVAGFDQAAVAGLQTMLANQSDQLRNLTSSLPANYGAGASPVTPSPIAAGLFSPKGTGTYVVTPNSTIAEVESDGSLFGMTGSQWSPFAQQGAATTSGVGDLKFYTTAGNLQTANTPVSAASSGT